MKRLIGFLILTILILPFVFGALRIPTNTYNKLSKEVSSAPQIAQPTKIISKQTIKQPIIYSPKRYITKELSPKKNQIISQPKIKTSSTKPFQTTELKPRLSKDQIIKTKESLPKFPTSVDCYEFSPKKIDFPAKNYEKINDCELLSNRAIADEYIIKIRETARKCFEQARNDLSLFDQRLQKIIQEVNNVNEISGRGITEMASSLTQESLDSINYDYSKFSDTNQDNKYKIKGALDALTRQVEGICSLSGNINNNVFRLCQNINQRITTGTDRHNPGLTKAEKEGFIKALQNQKKLADNNFNSARSNYKIVDQKEKLENIIFAKGLENTCEKGYPSSGLFDITEAEKKKKGILPIKEIVANKRVLKKVEEKISNKRIFSRKELNRAIEEAEAQQEQVKDRRQQDLSYFQTSDQRANQNYNTISFILRTMYASQNASRRGII